MDVTILDWGYMGINGQENGLNSYYRSHFLGHKSDESSGFARCQSTAYLGFRV